MKLMGRIELLSTGRRPYISECVCLESIDLII